MRCFECGYSGHLVRWNPENIAHCSKQSDGVNDNTAQNEDGEFASTTIELNSSHQQKVVSADKNVEFDLTKVLKSDEISLVILNHTWRVHFKMITS